MTLGQGRGEPCPWFGHIPKSLFHVGEPQHLCPLNKKCDDKAGGLESAPSLMALAQEWDLLRRCLHEKRKQCKGAVELKLAPSPSSTFFLPLQDHLILLPLPLHPPLAQLGLGTFSLCSFSPASWYNFSLSTSSHDPCSVPAFLPPARRFPRAFLLCLSTLQSGTLQQCSLIICLPNPSMRGSPR